MIRVEMAAYRDLGDITTLEIKGQEFPFTLQEAQAYVLGDSQKAAFVARIAKRAVGAALISMCPADAALVADHITVHPTFRGAGVSTALLNTLSVEGSKAGMLRLRINVPSYKVEDKEDPWNLEHWLWKHGFKAKHVIDGECRRYGRDYDTYVFERSIDV
jgi:GNAT superfamily N-acetyltransferase